jgi:hypothetical protein
MWKSRDLALVILMTVTHFIFTVLVGQLAMLFTGILGSNLIFTIGHSIIISFAVLIYQGKRWRFLLQHILFAFLVIPTNLLGTPFEVLPRIAIIIHGIQGDILFSSLYGIFRIRNKLIWLSVFVAVEFSLTVLFINILWHSLFHPPEFIAAYTNTVLLLLPVVIIESIFGGIIGYRIYQRIKKLGYVKDQ